MENLTSRGSESSASVEPAGSPQHLTLSQGPAEQETLVVDARGLQTFDLSSVSMGGAVLDRNGTDLILDFANGGRLVLTGFFDTAEETGRVLIGAGWQLTDLEVAAAIDEDESAFQLAEGAEQASPNANSVITDFDPQTPAFATTSVERLQLSSRQETTSSSMDVLERETIVQPEVEATAVPRGNTAPVAEDVSSGVGEDASANTINAAYSDVDATDTLVVTVNTSVTLGQVTINGDGTFSYNPNGQFENLSAGETATDTFTYTVDDGQGGTDTATVTITITGENDAPETQDLAANANEDGGAISVNASYSDADATESHDFSIGTSGTLGTVTNNGDGTFSYNPSGRFENLAAGETATDTFTYTVDDGEGGTDTATVTITITGENDAPEAKNDTAPGLVTEDETNTIDVDTLLGNDSDVDSGDLTVSAVDTTSDLGATLTLIDTDGDGIFDEISYDPTASDTLQALGDSETETDTFSYTVSDGNGGTDTATVTVTVSGENDAPDASALAASATENGGAVKINASYTDVDATDSHKVTVDTTGTLGKVTDNGDGTFSYDANGQFEKLAEGKTETDTFTYTVDDGQGETDTATVTVTITGENDAPEADDSSETVNEAAELTGQLAASDIDGDSLSYSLVSDVDNGTLSLNADGTFSYTPASGFTGEDSFTYRVTDEHGASDEAKVTIAINVAPGALDDHFGADDSYDVFIADDSGVLLLVNDGAGNFTTQQIVGNTGSDGFAGSGIAVGDLDGDGDLDAVAVSSTNGTILLTNDGTGQFSIDTLDAGATAFDVELGDLDNDGDLDIYLARAAGNRGTEPNIVFRNETTSDDAIAFSEVAFDDTYNDNLNFSDSNSYNQLSYDVAIGDLDGDGDLEVVETGTPGGRRTDNAYVRDNQTVENEASVDASTALFDSTVYETDTDNDGRGISLADLDNDGDLDAVIARAGSSATDTAGGNLVYINENGVLTELSLARAGDDLGDYGLGTGTDDILGLGSAQSRDVAVGDVNGDGALDLVFANSNGRDESTLSVEDTVYLNRGDGTFEKLENAFLNDDSNSTTPDHYGSIDIELIDLDGDGDLDAFFVGASGNAANGDTDTSQFWINDGTGVFALSETFASEGNGDVALGDVDGDAALSSSSTHVLDVLANDGDTDGDKADLKITGITDIPDALAGTLTHDGAQISFDPSQSADLQALADGVFATYSFTYEIEDAHGATDTATVTVTVMGENDAPVANDDTVDAASSTVAEFDATDLVDNDTDLNNDDLSVTAIDAESDLGASLSLVNNDGDGVFDEIAYDPTGSATLQALAVGETATDTFTYTISDGNGGSDTATVTVTLAGENDAPTAEDDSVTSVETFSATKLLAEDGTSTDHFGAAVGISPEGTFTVVGARYDDDFASLGGSAYLFDSEGSQVAKLEPDDIDDGDFFGEAVAVSSDGETIVVGASKHDLLRDPVFADYDNDAGAVYLFNSSGKQTDKLTASGSDVERDQFGSSVAVSENGNTIVVGATGDDNAAEDAGAVYVFNGNGRQVAKLTADDADDEDYFGDAVAVSGDGNTVVVGARYDDDNGTSSGSAYIFNRSGSQQAKLTPDDGAQNDNFGSALAVSQDGSVIVVGAYGDDDKGSSSGAAYVFDGDGTQLAKLTAEDGVNSDFLGFALGLSADGQTLAIGAYGDDDNGSRSGSVYVYSLGDNGDHSLIAKLTAGADGSGSDFFGIALSVSEDGSIILVGANGDDDNGSSSGSAYTFVRNADGAYVGQDGFVYDSEGVTTETASTAVGYISEDESITIDAGDLLANDSDVENDTLSITGVATSSSETAATTANSANGAALALLDNDSDGTIDEITYDPTSAEKLQALGLGESLEDTFVYEVSDGNGGTDTATVTVTVTGVNDAPDAVDDTAETNEDETVTIQVLDNDTDVDGDDLSITSFEVVSGGGSVSESNGDLVYVPADDYSGEATLSYTMSDSHGATDTATVTVTVNAVNDAPEIALDDTDISYSDTSGNDSFSAASISYSITDTEGAFDYFTISNPSGDTPGTFTYDGSQSDGTLVFSPDDGVLEGLTGDQSYSYTLTAYDTQGGSSTQTITVDVDAANDTASLSGDTTGSVTENSDTSVSGTLTVTDRDGATSSSVKSTGGSYGDFQYAYSTGKWTYTLHTSSNVHDDAVEALGENDTLTETFTVTSLDGSASETVTVTVNGSDDAADVSYSVGDPSSTIGVLAEDGSTDTWSGSVSVSDIDTSDDVTARISNISVSNAQHDFDYDDYFSVSWVGLENSNTNEASVSYTVTILNDSFAVQLLESGENVNVNLDVSTHEGYDDTITYQLGGTGTWTFATSGLTSYERMQPFREGSSQEFALAVDDTWTKSLNLFLKGRADFDDDNEVITIEVTYDVYDATSDTITRDVTTALEINHESIYLDSYNKNSGGSDNKHDKFEIDLAISPTNYGASLISNDTDQSPSGDIFMNNVSVKITASNEMGNPSGATEYADFSYSYRYIIESDPLAFDLNGDGTYFADTSDVFAFEIDGGVARAWTSPDDGILAMDLDGSGVIENGSELFSLSFDGGDFSSGLEALATLDSNQDGLISALDDQFAEIKMWVDADSDGLTDLGELLGLSDHGIEEINLAAEARHETVDGVLVSAYGTATATGGETVEFAEFGMNNMNVAAPAATLVADGEAAVAEVTAVALVG